MHRACSRALLATALLALAPGCQLVLDFAPLADAGRDTSALCGVSEPNDDMSAGAALAFDTEVEGAICADGDLDYYLFSVDGTQDVVAYLTFASGDQDLEMKLWSVGNAAVVTVSTGQDGDERIEQSMDLGNRLAAGDYAVEVLGRSDATFNGYQLVVSLDVATGAADAGPL
jgi:hypothetical protein